MANSIDSGQPIHNRGLASGVSVSKLETAREAAKERGPLSSTARAYLRQVTQDAIDIRQLPKTQA